MDQSQLTDFGLDGGELAKAVYFNGARFYVFRGALWFIAERPFYSAGKIFEWKGPTVGFGINIEALEYAKDHGLKVRVMLRDKKSKCYETTPGQYLLYGHDWNEKGVMLKVLQWSKTFFKTIELYYDLE